MSEESDGEELEEHVYETVVKSSLLKFIKNDAAVDAIRKRVEIYSKRANLASVALCGILKECFAGYEDVLKASIPEIFKQTFIRQLMLGCHTGRVKDPFIEDYFSRFPFFLKDIIRYTDDSNIYTRGAKLYITNFGNSIMMNFENRVKTYTKNFEKVFGLSKGERVAMYYNIMGWTVPVKYKNYDISKNKNVVEAIKEQRRILGLGPKVKVTNQMTKRKSFRERVLRQWVFFNRFYNIHGFKKFSLVPINSIRHHFISIDREALHGISKDLELVEEGVTREKFLHQPESDKYKYWKKIFKLDYMEKFLSKTTRNLGDKVFSELLNTDGVSLCTHFKKKASSKVNEKPTEIILNKNPETTIVLGIDPGRVNIYCVVEILKGKVISYILKRSEYYRQSGIDAARKHTETWSKNVQECLNDLSKVSIKGESLVEHNEYLKVYFKTFQKLWDEYSKPRWARQRLRLYGGKKRVFAEFFNKITKGREHMTFEVAYGAAKFAPGGKNEISVPTSTAYKECAYRFLTKPVDEHLTTKVENETKTILKGVKFKTLNTKSKSETRYLRGLYWCSSTTAEKQGKFINRDVNAALNIRECGMASERPNALKRAKNAKKVEIAFGVAIRCNKKNTSNR